MTAGVLRCTGDVTVDAYGAPLCSELWTLVPVPAPFEISQLDPAMISAAFGAGFGIVGACWFAGWCARALISMIR